MVALAEKDAALTARHLSPEIQATRRTTPAATAPESELRIRLDQSLPEAVELLERTMCRPRSNGRTDASKKRPGCWGSRGRDCS